MLKPEVNLSASECISKLAKLGVESRPFFYPLHMQPVLKPLLKENQIRCINAEFLGEKGFYLPSGVGNTDEEIWTSAQKLLEVINGV